MSSLLLSLRHFLGQAWRPRTPLARDLVPILFAKLIAIILIKVMFFSGDARPTVDADSINRNLLPGSVVSHSPDDQR